MALLRPCGKVLQTFSKLQERCQIKRLRNIVFTAGSRGYVAVAPKHCYANTNSIEQFEKFELPNNYINENTKDNSSLQELDDTLQRKLILLCLSSKNGMVQNSDLMKMLDNYSQNDNELRNKIGSALLRYCGNSLTAINAVARRNLTSNIWNLICKTTSKLTLEHYHTLLCIYAENGETINPKQFLESMTVQPDATTFQLLLNVVAKYGDTDSIAYLLSRMKNIGYSMNETVFNYLIEAHSNNKDIKSALSILDSMKNAKIEPTTQSYANIASGYALLGNFHDTMKIMNSYPFNTQQIMEIVQRLSISGLGKHIPDVLKFFKDVHSDDYVFISNIVTEMTYAGKLEEAFTLIKNITLDEELLEVKNNLYCGFFKNIVRANITKEVIMDFVNRAIKSEIYPAAILDTCEIALRSENESLALTLFETMHEKNIEIRSHYYWPLLIKASKTHGEFDVIRILKHMQSLKVPIDHDTCYFYVLPFINTVDPLNAIRKLGDHGISTSIVFTPLICYLLKNKGINDALALCGKLKTPIDFSKVMPYLVNEYKLKTNIRSCVMMLTYAPPGKYFPEEFLMTVFGKNPNGWKAEQLGKFLRAFETHGVSVMNFEYSVEQENTNTDRRNKNSKTKLWNPLEYLRPPGQIPHPRDMNRDELECHLIELKAKSMNQRGVMRKLIQLYCRENNIIRVDELSKEYNKNNFAWSPGMHSNVIDLYARNGRTDEAMSLYKILQRDHKDFKIDAFKILNLAIALVQDNRINEAIALLEANPTTEFHRNSQTVHQLLDLIARSSNSEMTDKMFDVVMKMKYCAISNSLVGPLVNQHILRGDLKTAVETFRKYAEKYQFTPLRLVLVTAIVESMKSDNSRINEYRNLLNQVQNITRDVKGIAKANSDLIIAFAKCGMKQELRNLFEKSRVPKLLENSLARVGEEDKLVILTEILDASIDVSKINRGSIYEQILTIHSRSGDCEKAIELWKKMYAEDRVISRLFRTTFTSLLEKHNIPLPENFQDSVS